MVVRCQRKEISLLMTDIDACCHHSVNLLIFNRLGQVLLQYRDGGGLSPWTWGLWGGALEKEDGDVLAAVLREAREELRLATRPEEWRLLDQRQSVNGDKIAHLYALQSPVSATDIQQCEGAGYGFFRLDALDHLPIVKSLRYWVDKGCIEAAIKEWLES